jgi:hypothetical protein
MKILGIETKYFAKKENADTDKHSLFAVERIRESLMALTEKNPLLWPVSATIIGIILFLLIIWFVRSDSNSVSNLAVNENKNTAVVIGKLTDINTQLQALTSNPQNSDSYRTAINNIAKDDSDIKSSIANLQNVPAQIASVKEDVDSQMLDLKREIAGGAASKQYLDAKVLPFHVISVDVISQQPFVSINYDNHITPFAVGDSIAGWTIAAADYDASTVEFKNDHDQYVKVTLQG